MSSTLPPRFAPLALRLASFAALTSTALVLVGDSTDCPDGYTPVSFTARITSDCPTRYAPATATLRVSSPNDDNAVVAFDEAYAEAGFANPSSIDTHDGGPGRAACTTTAMKTIFTAEGSDDDALECPPLTLPWTGTQVLSCTANAASSAQPVADGGEPVADGGELVADGGELVADGGEPTQPGGQLRCEIRFRLVEP